MSSSPDITNTLHSILKNIYQYGGPILIILGTVSSVMSLFLYVRKNLRKHPVLIYFIARNITNLLFIYLSLLYVTLAFGYNITPSSYNISYCHFCIYMSILCDILSPFYLILASCDGVLFTSPNVQNRKRSTCRLACILSISGTIFWIIFHTHSLIYSEIVAVRPNNLHCDLQMGLYSTLITYYTLIIKGIIAPVLLLIFGLWIIKNIRDTRRIIIDSNITIIENNSCSKDRQIVIILMKDIIIYIVFSSIMSSILTYILITQRYTKNYEEKEIEYFIRHIGTFCVSIPFCIGYYTNLIVSKTFRNEVKNILLCK
jgi:hypothetical protein